MILSIRLTGGFMNLKLTAKTKIDGDIYLFTFQPPKPLLWKAGQQIVVTLPHPHPDDLGISRTFSIASAPFEKDIMVTTHCSPQASTFKKALRELREGDTVESSLPTGDFIMDHPEKEHLFIAAGVGIAPYRAILQDLDFHNQPLNITLMYSHRSEHFPFKEEIEELLERHPEFKVYYTIDPTEIERGRIKEKIANLEDLPIYMSGIYIRKITNMLNHHDVSTQRTLHSAHATPVTSRQREIQQEEGYLSGFWGE